MLGQINSFLTGWRGFLVGTHRTWHAHQRVNIQGIRQGFLLGDSTTQLGQLRRGLSLVGEIFTRGGQLWTFGLGGSGRATPWGVNYPVWKPGVLSNHFFTRLKKIHFLGRGRQVFQSRRPRRRKSRAKLSKRWGRLFRTQGLPRGVYRQRTLYKLFTQAVFSGGLTSAVQGGIHPTGWNNPDYLPVQTLLRGGYLRRWLRLTPGFTRVGRGWAPPGRVGPRGVRWGRLRRGFQRGWTRRAGLRTRRVRTGFFLGRVALGLASPPRRWTPPGSIRRGSSGIYRRRRGGLTRHFGGVSRFQNWPLKFPSLLLGGGFSLLGATLLNEVQASGSYLVYFGPPGVHPGGVVFFVLWNQNPQSLEGVTYLVEDLHGRSLRASLLRVLWGRLSFSSVVSQTNKNK